MNMKEKSKRQRILQAAEKLFTSRRFDEVTTDDIMYAAGVGKGTIYRYFENKDDLFFQVAISGFDELCELLDKKVPEGPSFQEKLLSACQHIGNFLAARHQLVQIMQIETSLVSWLKGNIREQWMGKLDELADKVAKILSEGVDSGQIRADIPPRVLAYSLLGMLRIWAQYLTDFQDAAHKNELLVDLFCEGARPNRRE
jgi:TetR/AcrR family fatty acid metabolism transcriptional regulator